MDHVALRVADPRRSAQWYAQHLGLTPWQPPEWEPFPVFLLGGPFGIALFPVQAPATVLRPHTRHFVTIDHFAFRVSLPELEAARMYFAKEEVPCQWQDHVYFQSLYLTDPDGHTVELTAPTQAWDAVAGTVLAGRG
ncbi:MAG: VOC family protein [Lewinella sp.]|nr:VOC family protein [Lewinella sp.]